MAVLLITALAIPVFIPVPTYATDDWYNVSWTYRRALVIDHTKVDANLTDFTVLVKLTDGVNFTAANAQADGSDIRFVGTDGTTVYNYEREYHTNAGGGTSYYWVKIPSVSSTADTTFYVYYGNAGAADGENATGAWDSYYQLVWHMNDANTSQVGDSTSHSRTGNKDASNQPIQSTTAQIYKSQDFTTAAWFIAASYDVGNVFTLQMWVRPTVGYDANPCLWSGVHTDTYGGTIFDQNLFWNTDTGKAGWSSETNNSYVYSTTSLTNNTWGYVACSSNNKSNKIYVNADAAVSYTSANNPAGGVSSHYNGSRGDQQQYYHGQMDEFRWSNTQRADAWIHADYYSQSDALIAYGSESTGTSCIVSTVAASNILSTVARLNGSIVDEGDAECAVVFGWDTVSHAADFSAYSNNITLDGTYATSESFYYDASSLTASTTYYFNTYAYNGVGTDTGTELSFTTSATATGSGIGAPTFFTGTPSATYISLTWVRGASTNTTVIRYASGNTAPTSNTTGTLLYNSGLTYTSLTGLAAGRTYSFIAWGVSPEGAWSTSNVTLTVTTLAIAESSDTTPSSTTPDNFFTDTDYTNMESTLFYDIINLTIDNMGFQRNMGWFLLSIMLTLCMAIIGTIWTRKLFVGLTISVVGMGIGWLQGLVPLWIPLASALLIFALVGHQMRNQGG